MAAAIKEPEVYYLQPTACAPNSPLPYLVYRNVLPQPLTEASTAEFLEASGCWKKTVRPTFDPTSKFFCCILIPARVFATPDLIEFRGQLKDGAVRLEGITIQMSTNVMVCSSQSTVFLLYKFSLNMLLLSFSVLNLQRTMKTVVKAYAF